MVPAHGLKHPNKVKDIGHALGIWVSFWVQNMKQDNWQDNNSLWQTPFYELLCTRTKEKMGNTRVREKDGGRTMLLSFLGTQ